MDGGEPRSMVGKSSWYRNEQTTCGVYEMMLSMVLDRCLEE